MLGEYVPQYGKTPAQLGWYCSYGLVGEGGDAVTGTIDDIYFFADNNSTSGQDGQTLKSVVYGYIPHDQSSNSHVGITVDLTYGYYWQSGVTSSGGLKIDNENRVYIQDYYSVTSSNRKTSWLDLAQNISNANYEIQNLKNEIQNLKNRVVALEKKH